MGVAWGIDEVSVNEDLAELIARWQPLGRWADDNGINIMRGTDRLHLGYDAATDEPAPVTVTPDPAARARIDALRCGDGSYGEFEQLFDGYELFVPFDLYGHKVEAPGTPIDGKYAQTLQFLINSTRGNSMQLARDLHEAALLADELRMMIGISY